MKNRQEKILDEGQFFKEDRSVISESLDQMIRARRWINLGRGLLSFFIFLLAFGLFLQILTLEFSSRILTMLTILVYLIGCLIYSNKQPGVAFLILSISCFAILCMGVFTAGTNHLVFHILILMILLIFTKAYLAGTKYVKLRTKIREVDDSIDFSHLDWF